MCGKSCPKLGKVEPTCSCMEIHRYIMPMYFKYVHNFVILAYSNNDQ